LSISDKSEENDYQVDLADSWMSQAGAALNTLMTQFYATEYDAYLAPIVITPLPADFYMDRTHGLMLDYDVDESGRNVTRVGLQDEYGLRTLTSSDEYLTVTGAGGRLDVGFDLAKLLAAITAASVVTLTRGDTDLVSIVGPDEDGEVLLTLTTPGLRAVGLDPADRVLSVLSSDEALAITGPDENGQVVINLSSYARAVLGIPEDA
jgi:hypothetical protein